jgi:hypothetical protein
MSQPIVEDALRARAEQAQSAAERLLELVEPEDAQGTSHHSMTILDVKLEGQHRRSDRPKKEQERTCSQGGLGARCAMVMPVVCPFFRCSRGRRGWRFVPTYNHQSRTPGSLLACPRGVSVRFREPLVPRWSTWSAHTPMRASSIRARCTQCARTKRSARC